MTKKISKKEIRHTVEGAVNQALSALEISAPSKRTKKVIGKISKKLSGEVKRELKKKNKGEAKATPRAAEKNGKRVKVEGIVG
jgi:hypothetical protein